MSEGAGVVSWLRCLRRRIGKGRTSGLPHVHVPAEVLNVSMGLPRRPSPRAGHRHRQRPIRLASCRRLTSCISFAYNARGRRRMRGQETGVERVKGGFIASSVTARHRIGGLPAPVGGVLTAPACVQGS